MTKREIVFMACRLMAIYLFMNSIPVLRDTLSTIRSVLGLAGSFGGGGFGIGIRSTPASPSDIALSIVLQLMPTLLNWFAGLGLWVFAREISDRIFEDMPKEVESEPRFAVGSELPSVAFGCVGLFFLVQDIPCACFWIISKCWGLIFWTRLNPFSNYMPAFPWLVRIPLCLWLLFGLGGLVRVWRAAQEKGMVTVSSAAPSTPRVELTED